MRAHPAANPISVVNTLFDQRGAVDFGASSAALERDGDLWLPLPRTHHDIGVAGGAGQDRRHRHRPAVISLQSRAGW